MHRRGSNTDICKKGISFEMPRSTSVKEVQEPEKRSVAVKICPWAIADRETVSGHNDRTVYGTPDYGIPSRKAPAAKSTGKIGLSETIWHKKHPSRTSSVKPSYSAADMMVTLSPGTGA